MYPPICRQNAVEVWRFDAMHAMAHNAQRLGMALFLAEVLTVSRGGSVNAPTHHPTLLVCLMCTIAPFVVAPPSPPRYEVCMSVVCACCCRPAMPALDRILTLVWWHKNSAIADHTNVFTTVTSVSVTYFLTPPHLRIVSGGNPLKCISGFHLNHPSLCAPEAYCPHSQLWPFEYLVIGKCPYACMKYFGISQRHDRTTARGQDTRPVERCSSWSRMYARAMVPLS